MGLLEPLWNESRASARVAARGFMSDSLRSGLFAFCGRQKVGTNLPPSESLLSFAAGKISAGLPPLCDIRLVLLPQQRSRSRRGSQAIRRAVAA
jgi:hypothetical protein